MTNLERLMMSAQVLATKNLSSNYLNIGDLKYNLNVVIVAVILLKCSHI